MFGEWLANRRRLQIQPVDTPFTIIELCAEYFRFCKTYYVKNGKPTDEQNCVQAANRHLKRNCGKILAKDFGPLSQEAVREQLIDADNPRGYINGNGNRIRHLTFRLDLQPRWVFPAWPSIRMASKTLFLARQVTWRVLLLVFFSTFKPLKFWILALRL